MRYLRILLISVLMSLSCSYIIMSLTIFTSPNEVMTGRDLLEEVIIAILLGVAISILSLIFWLEKIPLTGQLLLHFLGIIVCVFTAGYFGNWYDFTKLSTIILVCLLVIIIYCITWLLMKILTQKDVDVLNKTLQKRRSEIK